MERRTVINFTVTFANVNGRIASVDEQRATLVDGRLVVTGAAGISRGNTLTLIKDPRGADPGGAPAYHLPPGTPPALPAGRGGFTLLDPIAPAGTRGHTSEAVDVWGPGTGSSIQAPPGRTPIVPVSPVR